MRDLCHPSVILNYLFAGRRLHGQPPRVIKRLGNVFVTNVVLRCLVLFVVIGLPKRFSGFTKLQSK